jgi:hypothetical protein
VQMDKEIETGNLAKGIYFVRIKDVEKKWNSEDGDRINSISFLFSQLKGIFSKLLVLKVRNILIKLAFSY